MSGRDITSFGCPVETEGLSVRTGQPPAAGPGCLGLRDRMACADRGPSMGRDRHSQK
jgi:hypothetical protein